MTAAPAPWQLRPDEGLARAGWPALVAGVGGGALCTAGALLDPGQFLRSYLVAYLFFVGATLGCLAVLMIQYVTGGAWGAAVRRLLESGARTLPLMALLFIPVALGVSDLYEWARPDARNDPLLVHKQLYLNVPFFRARALLYFAAWIVVMRLLVRWSHEQDASGGPHTAERLELMSRGGLVLLGLTMTFASIDWGMSLEPHWFSTIYGILFMGGSVLSAFAIVIAAAASLARRTPVAAVVTADHFHDLGKLLLAFVMLWAYFALSQFLIVWSANLPEEIPWYLKRLHGGWAWLALGLVVFHFALPFVLLLSRSLKRRRRTLAGVAVALIVVRFADVFWMITPAFEHRGLALHWLDVAAVVAIGGLWLAFFVRHLASAPVVPLRDPALPLEG